MMLILTGCDLQGSKKGAEVCASLLSDRQLGAAPVDAESEQCCAVELWTTAGCHPHDARKVASRSGGTSASDVGRVAPVVVSEAALHELRLLAGGDFCVAIGECGLDYDRMFSPRDIQLAVFDAQVRGVCIVKLR